MSKEQEKQEEEWQAESDARTLASAIAILEDPERLKKAEAGAKRVLKNEQEYAEKQQAMTRALQQVAQKKARIAKFKDRYPRMDTGA